MSHAHVYLPQLVRRCKYIMEHYWLLVVICHLVTTPYYCSRAGSKMLQISEVKWKDIKVIDESHTIKFDVYLGCSAMKSSFCTIPLTKSKPLRTCNVLDESTLL